MKLVWWRLRIELARYRRSKVAWIGPAFMLAIVAFTFWTSKVMFAALVPAAPTFAAALLYALFAAVGVFLTIAALRWGTQRLFMSSDLELLMSLPIPTRRVVTLKTVEIAASSPVASVMLIAFSWGYLRAHDVPASLLIAVIVSLLLAAGAALPGIWVTLVLARIFSRGRVRALLAVLPPFIGATVAVAVPGLFESVDRTVAGRFDAVALDGIGRSMMRTTRALPTSWPADIAVAIGTGQPLVALRGFALTLAAVVALGYLVVLAYRTTFNRSWTQMSESSGRRRGGTLLERIVPPLPPAIRGAVLKEWRIFPRDLKTLTNLFFPAMIMGFVGLSNARQGYSSLILPLVFFATTIPNIAAVSLLNERRNLALLKAGPLRGVDMLTGKFVAYIIPLAPIVLAVVLAYAVLTDRSPVEIALLLVFALWTLCVAMIWHLGTTALWTNFEAERPRMPVGFGIGATFAAMAIVATQVGFGLWLAGILGGDTGPLGHPLLGIPAFMLAATTAAATAAVTVFGARRLERIDAP